MKNMFGETVKPHYEIALKQHVKGDCPDDYETVHYESGCKNYNEYVKLAKELSKHLSECTIKGYTYRETDTLDKGLAQVALVCYYEDDTSSYNEVWQDVYINGKKIYRFTW